MAEAGIDNILIATNILGAARSGRLASLQKRLPLKVCADNQISLREYSKAAEAAKRDGNKGGMPMTREAFEVTNIYGEDINQLDFQLKKNGVIVQRGNTAQMIWKIDELIAEISKFFTLKIGDIIFTGTPAGIGSISEEDLLEGYLMGKKAFSVKIK